MNDQNIEQSIKEKTDKLTSLASEISIRMKAKRYSLFIKARIDELQEKLQRRTKLYENQLIDEKIEIYQEVLKLLD